MSPFFYTILSLYLNVRHKKKDSQSRVLFLSDNQTKLIALSLLFFSLYMLPKLLHLPNRIRNQLKKTLTKTLM